MNLFNIEYFISIILLSGAAKVTGSPLAGNSQISSFFDQGQPSSSIREDEDAPVPINPKEIMFNPFWSVPGGTFEAWNFGLWTNPFWNLDLDANDVFWAVNPPADSQQVKGAGVQQSIPSNHFRMVAPEEIESSSDVSYNEVSQSPATLSAAVSPEYPARFSKEDWAAIFTLNQALRENPRLVYKLLSVVTPSNVQAQNQNTV